MMAAAVVAPRFPNIERISPKFPTQSFFWDTYECGVEQVGVLGRLTDGIFGYDRPIKKVGDKF
jgi:hypothetical protein